MKQGSLSTLTPPSDGSNALQAKENAGDPLAVAFRAVAKCDTTDSVVSSAPLDLCLSSCFKLLLLLPLANRKQ